MRLLDWILYGRIEEETCELKRKGGPVHCTYKTWEPAKWRWMIFNFLARFKIYKPELFLMPPERLKEMLKGK